MSKLQKFNHYVFAIFGTLILLYASYQIGKEAYQSLFHSYNYQEPEQLTDDQARKLIKENKFIQTISYKLGYWARPKIIIKENGDKKTLQSPYFIIPVFFSTLKKAHVIIGPSLGAETIREEKISYYHDSQYSNILVYNSKTKTTQKLFKERVTIKKIKSLRYQSQSFLALTIHDNETGFHHLYIYKFKEKSLIKLDLPPMKVETIAVEDALPFILIHGKKDFDKNDEINDHDPISIYSWNYKTNEINRFPDKEMHDSLQKILEGQTLKPMPAKK